MDTTVFDVVAVAAAVLAAAEFRLTIDPHHVLQTRSAITPIASNRILRPR
jgi:hypothetical protein